MTVIGVTPSMALSALWALRERTGGWPTTEEVARYLDVPATSVRAPLYDLQAQRLFRKRQRDGRMVWLPWDQS